MNQRERAVLLFLGVCLVSGTGILVLRRTLLARHSSPSSLEVTGAVDRVGTTDPRLDLNRAKQYELEALPGIGPVLAERIVRRREELGGFGRVSQILEVTGIGPKRYAAIKELVCVMQVDSSPD